MYACATAAAAHGVVARGAGGTSDKINGDEVNFCISELFPGTPPLIAPPHRASPGLTSRKSFGSVQASKRDMGMVVQAQRYYVLL